MSGSIDMLSSDEEDMIRLLQLCCQRIEAVHDEPGDFHHKHALHDTAKALMRKLPDLML